MIFSIGKASKIIGMKTCTLRKWHESGYLIPFKIINGIRYYSDVQLEQFKDSKNIQE